jgi:hypothetical protein
MPAFSWISASRRRLSSAPGCSSIFACASPFFAKISGTVTSVKSAGSHVSSSSQESGIDTRASGVGLTEYALAVVRSRAFWL